MKIKRSILALVLISLFVVNLQAKNTEFQWNFETATSSKGEYTGSKIFFPDVEKEFTLNSDLYSLTAKKNKFVSFNSLDPFSENNELNLDFDKFCLAENENQADKTAFNLVNSPQFLKPNTQESVFEENLSPGKKPFLYSTSLIINMGLNIADYLSTKEAIKHDGLVEGNPLAALYVKRPVVFTAVKIGWTIGNYFLMKKLYKKNKKLAWVVGTISNLVLSYVVANNISLISQVKKLENR
ncbi:DUF5658 family protein [Acidobacteriota bacterium]